MGVALWQTHLFRGRELRILDSGNSVSRTHERLCRDSPLGGAPHKPDPRSRWICFHGGLHSPLWATMVAMDTRGHPPDSGLTGFAGFRPSVQLRPFRRPLLINCPRRNHWISRRKNGRALSWLNLREMVRQHPGVQ